MILKIVVILYAILLNSLNDEVNVVYRTEGCVDEIYCEMLEDELDKVPKFILDSYYEDGWSFCITDSNIDSRFCNGKYGSVMGITLYDEKFIYLEDREEVYTDAVLHEIGHWFDYKIGHCSETAEFYDIYYSETGSFKSCFNITCYYDNKEMFAEGFWKYIVDGKTLRNCSPKLYAYINKRVMSYGFVSLLKGVID